MWQLAYHRDPAPHPAGSHVTGDAIFVIPRVDIPLRVKPISDSDRIGYRDIPTDLLWPHMAQVSSLGPGLFVCESTEAI